jgi:hypothetical protein
MEPDCRVPRVPGDSVKNPYVRRNKLQRFKTVGCANQGINDPLYADNADSAADDRFHQLGRLPQWLIREAV